MGVSVPPVPGPMSLSQSSLGADDPNDETRSSGAKLPREITDTHIVEILSQLQTQLVSPLLVGIVGGKQVPGRRVLQLVQVQLRHTP